MALDHTGKIAYGFDFESQKAKLALVWLSSNEYSQRCEFMAKKTAESVGFEYVSGIGGKVSPITF